jgi:hypothetical protein
VMIDVQKLTLADIGRRVRFKDGKEGKLFSYSLGGTIDVKFLSYHFTSHCRAEDLEFVPEKPQRKKKRS